MLAIVAVAAISLIWRVLSSDDPNELTRALRTVLLVIGAATSATNSTNSTDTNNIYYDCVANR